MAAAVAAMMWGVADAPERLTQAVERGLLQPLGAFDFRVAGSSSSNRGSTVDCTNGEVLIHVVADWLEGEVTVTLRSLGGAEVSYEAIVHREDAKALSLTRLPRSPSTGVLVSKLRRLGEALAAQAPDILSGSDEGHRRLAGLAR